MNNLLKLTALSISLVAFTTQCRKGCTDPDAINYDSKAKKENNSCEYEDETYTVPSTYTFTDASGNSTVDFSGQAARLDMLSEMVVYMKTGNTSGTTLSGTTLKAMYANNGYTWTDANGLGLTGSSKQLKNKTAYSTADGSPDAGIQALMESYMDSLEVISNTGTTGSTGVSGVWPNDGLAGPYLMDGNGIEYTQMIEKGLMAAVFTSQMTVNYLGTIADDDNTTLVSGTYYTEMQHHWDEAYGYFTSAVDFPTNGTDRFWGKYASGRDAIIGSATNISLAFRKGRAAIDNEDYTTRDAQIAIIRDEMEKLQAACAIHYLNDAKNNMTSNTARNHYLSEAYAFIDGLRFGYNAINSAGLTTAQIDQALGYIGTNFNAVTINNLNLAIDLLASGTGLDSVKDNL